MQHYIHREEHNLDPRQEISLTPVQKLQNLRFEMKRKMLSRHYVPIFGFRSKYSRKEVQCYTLSRSLFQNILFMVGTGRIYEYLRWGGGGFS